MFDIVDSECNYELSRVFVWFGGVVFWWFSEFIVEIVNLGKVWRMIEDDRICDVCKSEYWSDNIIIGLLNKWLILGWWEGFGDFVEFKWL